MKKRIVSVTSLFAIVAAYFIFEYPLIGLHEMKSFPLYLLIAGIIVIAIFGIIKGYQITPIFTVVGYIIGFFAGYFFKTTSYDLGGGRLDNMWIIWMNSYLGTIILGIIIDFISRKIQKTK